MSQPTFAYFLEQFPKLELPLTFSEDTVRTISRETPPLSPKLIEDFILPIEPGMADELTEFVACMQLPENDKYAGIIYWRADLLQYHYTLATFNPATRELISRQVIAGVSYDGEDVTQTQALINESLMIYQVSGQALPDGEYVYKASSSTARRFQVSPTGLVVEV